MQAHIRALVKRFGTAAKLAAIVGVTQDTVWSWTTGRRQPTGPARRTLEVLLALAVDAPLLLDTLTGPKQRELPALDLIARHPAERPKREDYWHARTVASFDDDPEITVTAAFLNSLGADRETTWLKELKEYETRTGRIFPGHVEQH